MQPQGQGSERWIRPRGVDRIRRRKRRHYRVGPGFAAAPAAATAGGPAPQLGLREPESTRHAIISGSVSLLAHGAIVGALVLSAWLAPKVVDDVIEVRIIKDLPGSNEEPAPAAPRVLAPRRAIANAARSATVVPRTAAVARPSAQSISAQALQVANITATAAPQQIQRQQVVSSRVIARDSAAPSASAFTVGQLNAAAVAPVDLTAPVAATTGPRQVAPGQQVTNTAPQAFTGYQEVADVEYSAQAGSVAATSTSPLADTGFALDATVADELIGGGGGSGGTGVAVGVARCLESSFVHRYLEMIRGRTRAVWNIPDNAPADQKVVLRFTIDASGSASEVRVEAAPNPALGESCMQALTAASPFPALDSNIRCLAGLALRGTFTTGSPADAP